MKISPAGSLWLNGFVAADLTILLQLYGAAEFREPDEKGFCGFMRIHVKRVSQLRSAESRGVLRFPPTGKVDRVG